MKYIFALSLLFAYSVGYTQIIINGKINNYDGKSKVHYLPTLDGIIPVLARSGKSIIPNPNGSFKIKYENDGFGTVQLHFNGLTFAFFMMKRRRSIWSLIKTKLNSQNAGAEIIPLTR